jgi:hypothetical protein
MTKDLELLRSGFREWPIPLNSKNLYKLADRFFQLKVVDNNTEKIKYFVDAHYYVFPEGYNRIAISFSIRFNANGKEITVEFSDNDFSSIGIDLHNN